jgi:hypothetical protein
LLCKDEGAHDVDPDPLSSLFLRKSLPHHHTDLTLPFCLTQGRQRWAPVSPVLDLAMAVAQICILAPKTSMPTIAEIPVERRAAPSPGHRRGKPQGQLPPQPAPARVSVRPGPIARRKRTRAVDHDLIERPRLSRTPSVPAFAGDRAPPVGRFKSPACARCAWSGLAQCGSAPDRQIPARVYFFQ